MRLSRPLTAPLLLLLFAAQTAAASFPDVTSSTLYRSEIEAAQARGLVVGFSDGLFHPLEQVTRGQLVTMVVRDLHLSTDGCVTSAYADMPATEWFYPYVCAATTNDIVNGYDDGTFRGYDPVTVAEMSKILVEAYDVPVGAAGANWYDASMAAIGLPPTANTPEHTVNRAEAAYTLIHLLEGGGMGGTKIWCCNTSNGTWYAEKKTYDECISPEHPRNVIFFPENARELYLCPTFI